jgi:thiol-disulfide isomerase/thioredoxin
MKRFISILVLGVLTGCAFKYKNNPELPSFNFLMIDSSTIYNTSQIPKGKPFVLVYFSPDCDACQEETEDLLKSMNVLKNTSFYFLTDDPFSRLLIFNKYYKIYNYSNIILGNDYEHSFQKHFRPGGTPYVVLYNGKKRLRAVYSGGVEAEKLVEMLRSLK